MIKVYTQDEYAHAYTEILEILKYFPKSEYKKIPKKVIQRYNDNMDKNYDYVYFPEKQIEEQKLSKLTKILLANIYIDYIMSPNEKKEFMENEEKELKKAEEYKNEQYDVEKIFKKRRKRDNVVEEESLMIVSKKDNLFLRILNKIKKIFKLT